MADAPERGTTKSEQGARLRDADLIGHFSDYTDLNGSKCSIKPQPGEFSLLQANRASSDCSYAKSAADLAPEWLQDFIAQTAQETIHLYSRLGFGENALGSGVSIADTGDGYCLALTDRHNVKGSAEEQKALETVAQFNNRDLPAPSATVMFANDKGYLADVPVLDEARDVAVLRIHTGADTETVCHPATFVQKGQNLSEGDTALTIGFPKFAHNPYLSVGILKRSTTLSQTGAQDLGIGEDQNRPVYEHSMATHNGNSGGGLYNLNKRVFGLISRSDNESRTVSTPLTQHDVDQLIGQAKRVPLPVQSVR